MSSPKWAPQIRKVLAHVKATRGQWELREDGSDCHNEPRPAALRKIGGSNCPALSFGWSRLGPKQAWIIAKAADVTTSHSPQFDPALRAALLEAAGLTEKP
jgi:hypothetical protein